jgi:hypothetical protein
MVLKQPVCRIVTTLVVYFWRLSIVIASVRIVRYKKGTLTYPVLPFLPSCCNSVTPTVTGVTADEGHHVLGAPSIEQGASLDGSALVGGQFGGHPTFVAFQPNPPTTQHVAEPSAIEMHAIIPARGGKRQRSTAEKEEEPGKRARNRGRREGPERSKGRPASFVLLHS